MVKAMVYYFEVQGSNLGETFHVVNSVWRIKIEKIELKLNKIFKFSKNNLV